MSWRINKKRYRPHKPLIDQNELWFMFEVGKFLRDIAEELNNVPYEYLQERQAYQLASDTGVIYDFGDTLDEIARRYIYKERKIEIKKWKKWKKLERKREEEAWLSSDDEEEQEETNKQPF